MPLPGFRLVTLADRPELREPMGDHNVAAWPHFMLMDRVANQNWDRLFTEWPAFQFVLLDASGAVAAAANAAPLAWDGSDAGLPQGWDEQFERSVADQTAGRLPDALGALQIVVASGRQGAGLGGEMLGAIRLAARERGFRAVIACVRPTLKARYPLTPIDRYVRWLREDGLPFDPWIRLHVRLGGRIVRPAPQSMRIEGSIAEWREWTGMAFPETGSYVVDGAVAPVLIDRETDRGTYFDENVWIVHDVGRVSEPVRTRDSG